MLAELQLLSWEGRKKPVFWCPKLWPTTTNNTNTPKFLSQQQQQLQFYSKLRKYNLSEKYTQKGVLEFHAKFSCSIKGLRFLIEVCVSMFVKWHVLKVKRFWSLLFSEKWISLPWNCEKCEWNLFLYLDNFKFIYQ